jgi:hypothetical protein
MISVLIRPTKDGYRAELWNEVVTGKTIDEVQEHLKSRVQKLKSEGNRVIEVEVEEEKINKEHPLAPFMGLWKDNLLFDDWQKSMEEYRSQRDKEEELEN